MLPPGGSICGWLTYDLPLGCLEGYTSRLSVNSENCCTVKIRPFMKLVQVERRFQIYNVATKPSTFSFGAVFAPAMLLLNRQRFCFCAACRCEECSRAFGVEVFRSGGRPCGGKICTRQTFWIAATFLYHRMYLSISFRKSTPPQNRHLIAFCH